MAAATVFDSVLFGNIFGTEEVRECFSERSYVSRMIEAECALAQAEEQEGVIPAGVSSVVREHSDVSKIDWQRLAARTEIVGYPVLPLVEQMSKWVPDSECKLSSPRSMPCRCKITNESRLEQLDTSTGVRQPRTSWTLPRHSNASLASSLSNAFSDPW
jgi:hypothetical protein